MNLKQTIGELKLVAVTGAGVALTRANLDHVDHVITVATHALGFLTVLAGLIWQVLRLRRYMVTGKLDDTKDNK